MPFVNHLCWERTRAHDVMNTNAEDVPDEIFLAVHSEHPLTLLDTNTGRYQQTMATREFLNRFLDPHHHHMQVVVQGDSGSGKSHLIKWMSLTIPQTDDRLVLMIPKAGMNLRRIVERIIEKLPESEQDSYRSKLARVGDDAATKDQKRWNLLGRIAEAIKSDPRADQTNNETETWLIKMLPNIFLDTQLRTILDRREGVIGELVEHIFDTPHEYRRRENQRLFGRDDLPLELEYITSMALPTREILSPLATMPSLMPLALDIINRNLDRAIAGVLNFSADQLIGLMMDLRKYLRKQGKSLVVLIEDFARLQGIDGAMLQALIEVGTPMNGLCELRWAMAVTTGYYRQVANTVQTRMDYLVGMDLPTSGANRVIGDDEIVSFAARYLNAARLHQDQLLHWKESRQDDEEETPVPNACETCAMRTACHDAFGHDNDIGLYPFTRKAVLNMAHRRDPKLEERFNPRTLVKDVLLQVVGVYGRQLEEGDFPPRSLLDLMGGSQLSTVKDDNLQRSNPNYERHLSALELWSGTPGEPERLAEGIYAAFGLSPAPDIGFKNVVPTPLPSRDGATERNRVGDERVEAENSDGTVNDGKREPKRRPDPRDSTPPVDPNVSAIRAWGRGHKLPEGLTQDLRELIWANLDVYVDWDAAGVHKVDLVKKDGAAYFRSRYINFRDQQTKSNVPKGKVSLLIPLSESDEHERRDTALALEGLWSFSREGSWGFENGGVMMGALGERLEHWSAHVLQQIRAIPDPEGGWNPVPSTVEVLAVGALLAGKLTKPNAPLAEQLNALFEPWPAPGDLSAQSEPWRKLYGDLHANQSQLKGLLKTWASAGKGGQAGAMMDASRVLPTFVQLRKAWSPVAVPPAEAALRKGEPYEIVGSLHKAVRSGLAAVARTEWERRTEWLEHIRQYVPQGTTWTEVLQSLQQLEHTIIDYGLACRKDVTERLKAELGAAKGLRFDAAISAIVPLLKAAIPVEQLPRLASRGVGTVVTQTQDLLKAVDAFFSEVETKLSGAESIAQSEGAGLKEDQARIEQAIKELTAALAAIGGSDAH